MINLIINLKAETVRMETTVIETRYIYSSLFYVYTSVKDTNEISDRTKEDLLILIERYKTYANTKKKLSYSELKLLDLSVGMLKEKYERKLVKLPYDYIEKVSILGIILGKISTACIEINDIRKENDKSIVRLAKELERIL